MRAGGRCAAGCSRRTPGRPSYTAIMTLKNAAALALIGTLLLTVLLAVDFLNTALGVVRDVVPAAAILRSLVYLFAGVAVTVFFYVFNREQAR